MNQSGLSSTQATALLKNIGPNELPSKQNISALYLLLAQFKNLLTLLLIAASVISLLSSDYLDGILILLIVILNSGLGFFQEFKASRELEALKKIETSNSRVIRDHQEIQIPSRELVPGDIVILESGVNLPADGVLIEAHNFAVNESSLTGESMPVYKTAGTDESMVFFGTSIVSGRAKLRVTATGVQTKFGKLALSLATIDEETTPLEISLAKLAKTVTIISVFLSLCLFAINYWQRQPIFDSFLSSVALLVASVPEGLPAIVTIVLTFGVRRMYQHKTLVRRLSSIESLGAATIICTDKTGTLTENKMSVDNFYPTNAKNVLIESAILCNSANLILNSNQSFDILGDTTEGALLTWAVSLGITPDNIRSTSILVEEIPFDSVNRSMTVLVKRGHDTFMIQKGAPEVVLPTTSLTPQQVTSINRIFHQNASNGLRVLAFASKKLPSGTTKIPTGQKLDFIGLVSIADTIRPSIAISIQKAKTAGIKTIMVTGDSELTARHVATVVGILSPNQEVFMGSMLESLTDDELDQQIGKIAVFARTSPEQKLRIVQSLQRLGEVVAVTGDGVNDSLALKQASVGVSMGITGTDVAKEAADIVLLDDNYSTLIKAIEEGRVIYQNILKTTKFLLTGNLAEVLLIMLASLTLLPTPLLPVQLLWVNFVTDGLPALALAADTPSGKIMVSPPRKSSESILSPATLRLIFIAGIIMALITLSAFYFLVTTIDLNTARTAAFSLIVVLQMIFVFLMRRHHSLTSNKYLLASVSFVLLSQLAIVTYPPLQAIFKLV